MKSMMILTGMCVAVCGMLVAGCAQGEAMTGQTAQQHKGSSGEWTGPLFRPGPSGRTERQVLLAQDKDLFESEQETGTAVGTEAQPAAYEAETAPKTESGQAWPRVGPGGRR